MTHTCAIKKHLEVVRSFDSVFGKNKDERWQCKCGRTAIKYIRHGVFGKTEVVDWEQDFLVRSGLAVPNYVEPTKVPMTKDDVAKLIIELADMHDGVKKHVAFKNVVLEAV